VKCVELRIPCEWQIRPDPSADVEQGMNQMQTLRTMNKYATAAPEHRSVLPMCASARDFARIEWTRVRDTASRHPRASRDLRFTLTLAIAGAFAAGSSVPTWAAIPLTESTALHNLYTSTNGDFWGQNAGWNGGAGSECAAPPNDWHGITCDAGGTHITEIDLGYNFLSGSLPDLSGLTALQVFHVNDNSLTGSIPSLAGLAALQVFDAIGNDLTGSIPALSGMTNLLLFEVTANHLTGSIPALTGLPNLQLFYVNDNLLTGSIPALGALTSVEIIEIGGNQLTGTIPSPTGLANLSVFEAELNHLTGSIPAMTGLTALYLFNVGGNQLSGPVPLPASPSGLVDGASVLCPNPLTHNVSAAWDAATGFAPWYSACDPIFKNGFE
jgi:hypothetical protein